MNNVIRVNFARNTAPYSSMDDLPNVDHSPTFQAQLANILGLPPAQVRQAPKLTLVRKVVGV